MATNLQLQSLRSLATRLVLVEGLPTAGLPYPLNNEMEAFANLQGTYKVKDVRIDIEDHHNILTNEEVETMRKKVFRAFDNITEDRILMVTRRDRATWEINWIKNGILFFIDETVFYSRGRWRKMTCYPEDRGIQHAVQYARGNKSRIFSYKMDQTDSLLLSMRYISRWMTAIWTCRTTRLC